MLPLCTFPLHGPNTVYTIPSLGIEVSGPRQVTFQLHLLDSKCEEIRANIPHVSLNLFGSIEPSPWAEQVPDAQDSLAVVVSLIKPPNDAPASSSTVSRKRKQEEPVADENVHEEAVLGDVDKDKDEQNHAQSSLADDRKDEYEGKHLQESSRTKDMKQTSDVETSQIAKRARKELAKQKQKELEETIAKERGFSTKSNEKIAKELSSKKHKKEVNLRSVQRLHGGVEVKDIIIGSGAAVKAGRKVSILYVGSFPDGEVFDKNQNRKSPLQFRLGTGEVIRGLDIGLEGMKVGGERIITVPSELGYGRKGSGKIPKNATLVFHVQLLRS